MCRFMWLWVYKYPVYLPTDMLIRVLVPTCPHSNKLEAQPHIAWMCGCVWRIFWSSWTTRGRWISRELFLDGTQWFNSVLKFFFSLYLQWIFLNRKGLHWIKRAGVTRRGTRSWNAETLLFWPELTWRRPPSLKQCQITKVRRVLKPVNSTG